jgi:uncharacterized protein (DUF433 family)
MSNHKGQQSHPLPENILDRLDDVSKRLARVESLLSLVVTALNGPAPGRASSGPAEPPAPPWTHLVARRHPWRRQLYIQGRNMTARQLVGSMRANQRSPEEAARDLDLPVEAVREALAYAEQNEALLRAEAEIERLLLLQRGQAGSAQGRN